MPISTGDSDNAKDWLGYREEIRVLDCTIRDGGLMNNHQFSDDIVRAVYQACVEGGIDYMELGYKASRRIFAPDGFGAWKYCSEDDVRRIVGDNPTPLKLSVMCDAEKTDYHEDVLPRDQSVIDMVRVATYVHQIPTAIDMINDATDKGYETTVNLMAVSGIPERELDDALELLAATPVGTIYIVDSFGALYSEQVQWLVDKYRQVCEPAGKQVGVHFHNNLQLAFANTIEGIIRGANRLDATFAGLGRGAGNCQIELLVAFLHNPKYHLRPLLRCVQDSVEPLRAQLKWGFDLPYLVTGMLNQHPRAAMAFNEAEERGDIVAFFDSVTETG